MGICSYSECIKQSNFGIPGTKTSITCSLHKLSSHVSLKKKCSFEGCDKLPKFGIPGTKTSLTCSKHKLDTYINLSHKICSFQGCKKQSTFGIPGTKKSLTCLEHKMDNYVNVLSKRCSFEGCNILPSFGVPGTKKTLTCIEHKLDTYVNLTYKTCSFEGCDKWAYFGIKGTRKLLTCLEHKMDHYINVKDTKCSFQGCYNRPSFGLLGTKTRIRCAEHKLDNYVNIKHKRCQSEACSIYEIDDAPFANKINPETQQLELCVNCWRNLYPELSKKLKVRKEHFILAEIQRQIPELEEYFTVWDCKIPGQSCVSDRPDMAWIVNDTLIHIEVDEDGEGHEDNDERIVGIHSASNCKNHVCIRFNPDDSYSGNTPCLKVRQLCNGEPVYERCPIEWDRRMSILIPEVRAAYENALNSKSICGKRKLCF